MSTTDLRRRLTKCEARRAPEKRVGIIGYARIADGELVEIGRTPGYEPDPDAVPYRFTFKLDGPQGIGDRKLDA